MMNEQKTTLESKVAEVNARLEAEEANAAELLKEKKRYEAECAELKKSCQARVWISLDFCHRGRD